jgi:hypothetical protein
MEIIILIACASQKRDSKQKAKDLYISTLFKHSFAYASRQQHNKIFILSALHCLLDIDKEIEPYNVTLSNVPKAKRKQGLIILTPQEKTEWGKKVLQQLSIHADLRMDKFIILAGEEYIKPIKNGIVNLINPLKGKRQGERLKFLKAN